MALAVGYSEFTAEDFYETVAELFERLKEEPMSALHGAFNDDGLSNYVVAYFRLLTAAYMKVLVFSDHHSPFHIACLQATMPTRLLTCLPFVRRPIR